MVSMSKAVPRYRMLSWLKVMCLPESSLNAGSACLYQDRADQDGDDNNDDGLSQYLPHQAASKCTHSFSDADLRRRVSLLWPWKGS